MGRERRRSERVDLKIAVQVKNDSKLQQFYSRNISGGGIFLEVDEFIPIGREVNLSFSIPGRSKPLKVNGRVVRHHTLQDMDDDFNKIEVKGVGLSFTDVSQDDQHLLDALVSGKELKLKDQSKE